ncbi:MAG: efflux RND transporter periplasmic adaptor subunit [Deltaproteobacteria bacterium]|nr:efflux RND transporter periplasmic adaptor subunit [Deltaproteobacteria bacterium]
MKKILFSVIFLLILAGTFLGGSWYAQRGVSQNPGSWGIKPLGPPAEEEADRGGDALTVPGAVKVTPQLRQTVGVRVEQVTRESQNQVLRTLGRVAANENLTYRIVSSTEGWVSSIKESTTGSLVQKDQLMATIYNYQFLTREQQYLYALDFEDRRQKSKTPPAPAPPTAPQTKAGSDLSPASLQPGAQESLPVAMLETTPTSPRGEGNPASRAVYSIRDQLEVAKLELYSLGVGDYQLKEIARTRKLASDIEIRSPVTGLVVNRNISPAQRFDRGVELFRIADLSRVWILADIFGREAQYIRPGMMARVFLPEYNKIFKARVSDILPQVDPTTRTLKVRLETENPGFALRPDMWVDIEFSFALPPAVTIPLDALLDSGLKKTVFVDLGNGVFEPRAVETGWRFNNRVEIIRGLKPGERIAVSGTFLIDSESRMELAASGMSEGLTKDPVCGRDVSMRKAVKEGLKSIHGGKTYYFSSAECRTRFEKNPDRYVEKPTAEEISRQQSQVLKKPRGNF